MVGIKDLHVDATIDSQYILLYILYLLRSTYAILCVFITFKEYLCLYNPVFL